MAVRLLIDVDDISFVLDYYDQIKIYRSTTESESYIEITDADTRINLIPEQTQYYYDDTSGDDTLWYKTSYYHSVSTNESAKSIARLGGTEAEKIGWSFDNYLPKPGEWGKILTADDMRYTYMWGIDATASDVEQTNFEDEQFDFFVREALADFETLLTVDIRKRVYKTEPESILIRGKYWREGVDYTDEDDAYTFDPAQWQNFGFLQLRHMPILSIERAMLVNQVGGDVIDLLEQGWVRVTKKAGQLHFYPTTGQPYGPFHTGVLPWRLFGGRFPQGFKVDYTTGYPSAEFVPDDLRSVIGMWACIKCLQTVGDGLLAGFSSQSVSLDGLSESFSSTQSASVRGDTITEFGAIADVYLNRKRFIGKEILSVNLETGQLERKTLLNVVRHRVPEKKCYKITVQSGEWIVVTEDHSLFDSELKEIWGDVIQIGSQLRMRDHIDVVANVQVVPTESFVYDFSVEDNENFIANGFVCHNTSAFFGARILSYTKMVDQWLVHNRFKYGAGPPLSFVGY